MNWKSGCSGGPRGFYKTKHVQYCGGRRYGIPARSERDRSIRYVVSQYSKPRKGAETVDGIGHCGLHQLAEEMVRTNAGSGWLGLKMQRRTIRGYWMYPSGAAMAGQNVTSVESHGERFWPARRSGRVS